MTPPRPAFPEASRPSRREWALVCALTILLVALINLPYLLAYRVGGTTVFGGILLNPLDGFSYLAKLREGWRGEWLFTLPYTADPGQGVFIYSYYLALGHLARWTGASLDLVYQLARLLGAAAFLLSAYHFIARFVDQARWRLVTWLIFTLGSGLGWAAAAFSGFTSDFWVAEAFPFLTLLSNAHFPLTWACLLWLFEWTLPGLAPPATPRHLLLVALLVTLTAQVQPMVLITVLLILGGMAAGRWLAVRKFVLADWLAPAVVAAAALPWILNALWVTRSNPALAAWNAQNITLTPAAWDLLLSGGLPLLLALIGLIIALRRREAADQILLYWFILGVLSLYAPFGLQRRLSLGLWMPLTLLAVLALRTTVWPVLSRLSVGRALSVVALVILLPLTNLLVYTSALHAVQVRDASLFISSDEAAALNWLDRYATSRAVVLASADIALLVPVRSDARVIYGHPFETVDAQAKRLAVEDFFSGKIPAAAFFAKYSVDLIFYGPREKQLGRPDLSGWRIVFQQGQVSVYGR